MKVLHYCFRYFPDRGGSEGYTSTLVAGLQLRGVTSVMVTNTSPVEEFTHAGIRVRRMGGVSTADFPSRFSSLLNDERPDIVHYHVGISEWSQIAVGITRQRRLPYVLTYHIANMSCPRGDMMQYGATVCSGELVCRNCLPCRAVQLGLPRALADRMPKMTRWVERVAQWLPAGKLRTACLLRSSVEQRIAENLGYLRSCARIVVLSEWSRQVLRRNGVSEDRIVLSRIGTHHPQPLANARVSSSSVIRGIFVGRMHSTKGVSIIAEALNRCEQLPMFVDAFGPPEAEKESIVRSSKLRLVGLLADDQVVQTMSQYDFAVVPSQICETGPYVVVEALQAGLPVLGSDVPAISELVTHGVNGLLAQLGSVDAWVELFHKIHVDSELLPRLRQAASFSRTMQDAADDMVAMYEQILHHKV